MILVYDTEVFKYDWMLVAVDLMTKEETFIINDSQRLKDFYESHKNYIWVGFNSRHYDTWIIRALLKDYNPYDMSKWIIQADKKGWEYDRSLSKIQHYDYDARWSNIVPGLKTLEAFMGDDIRETTVSFDIDRPLTEEELQRTLKYCRHDVNETMKVFAHAKNEFNAHFSLVKEFNLELATVSKTNAQLTALILNAQRTERNDEWDFDLEEPCNLLKKYKYIADWFRDPANRNPTASFETEVAGIPIKYAWGGCHGAKPNYFASGNFVHCDVNSYYPSLMIEWGLLSRNCRTPEKFKEIYDKRLALKRAGKKAEQAPYKVILNSTYGASGDKNNALFDPRQAHRVCANGQIFLTLLIEMMEGVAEAFNVNTDGVFFNITDLSKLDDYYRICKEWEQITRMGLGHDKYTRVWQRDVNNYIIELENGDLDQKGAVVKNTSVLDNDLPIVNKAVVNWFVRGVPPEKTIQDCKDLQEFQKVFKLSNKYNYAMQGCTFDKVKGKNVWKGDGVLLNDKSYRVFASKEKTGAVYKKKTNKNPEKFANCPDNCFIENDSVAGVSTDDYPQLDKQWYIDTTWYRIRQFKGEVK